jgi:hypothetical protein
MKSKSLKELILNKRKFKVFNKDRLRRIDKEELIDKNLLSFEERDYQKLKTISEQLIKPKLL